VMQVQTSVPSGRSIYSVNVYVGDQGSFDNSVSPLDYGTHVEGAAALNFTTPLNPFPASIDLVVHAVVCPANPI